MPIRYSVFVIAFIFLAAVVARADDTVKFDLHVTVPKETPADATLYLAGNLPAAGSWKVNGVPLVKADDGSYGISLNLPTGQVLKYKINRGSWDTVEKAADGSEISDRTVTANADKTESITVAAWADKGQSKPAPVTPKSTVTGDVHYHQNFHSKILGNDRTVIVWLPPGYNDDPAARFPVLYLHDGQNCFDAATSFAGEWHADETADALIRAGKIRPIIMVAVANAHEKRTDEYTPDADKTHGGGNGEEYAQFLITELKPFIDQTYRTKPDRLNTTVAGSSLGGLISLYLGVKHSNVFGQLGVISPSLWWNDHALLKQIQADPGLLKNERLWIDIGTSEGTGDDQTESVKNARDLAAAVAARGMTDGTDYHFLEVPGAQHNETAWAARFDQVLLFLFGTAK